MSLRVWEYDRGGEALASADFVAFSRLEPPDFRVERLSSLGEYVTFEITSGALRDPSSILYVENHGTFEIARVEPWPDSGRFLVLRAWPCSTG